MFHSKYLLFGISPSNKCSNSTNRERLVLDESSCSFRYIGDSGVRGQGSIMLTGELINIFVEDGTKEELLRTTMSILFKESIICLDEDGD